MSKYKPGTVAKIRLDDSGRDDAWVTALRGECGEWITTEHHCNGDEQLADVRPLVMLDLGEVYGPRQILGALDRPGDFGGRHAIFRWLAASIRGQLPEQQPDEPQESSADKPASPLSALKDYRVELSADGIELHKADGSKVTVGDLLKHLVAP